MTALRFVLSQKPGTHVPLLYTAWNAERDCSLGHRILLARSSQERRDGLLKNDTLPVGAGLWIAPCEAIHTFKMKFAIDVVFLNSKRRVVKLCPRTPASRICFCVSASSVLELPVGTINATRTCLHDYIDMRRPESAV